MAVFALHAFLDAFASFLWRRLAFLSFLRRKPLSTTQMNEITINVRFSADLVIPLSLARDATVQNLKERLAERLSLPVEEICVIFAGQELVDQVSIKDYNVEEQTTVHAVRSANGEAYMSAEVCCPLGEGIVTSQLTEEEHLARKTEVDKALFFVYCKQPCDRVLPGKLRVCCATCGEGSFILQKDPSCWQDVLEPGRLSGQCQICHEVRAARFFFKCTGTVGSHDDQVPIVLQLIRYNYLRVPCLACLDISQLVLVFKCAHVICLDCFRAYCHSRLDERGFVQHPTLGWTLPCPVGCADSLIEESHHFYLLGSEQFVFCRQCLQGHHLGPCSSSRESGEEPAESAGRRSFGTAAQGSSWDEASRLTVQATTKPCPKCRTPTERSGGCMHMVCSRSQCGFQWCWLCQDEWTRQCMGAHWFG
ncbi:E3 ubiquitin-protein ligase parkin-like isoform X4 [Dermacentor silvarum]|uniref:E3 ubiquitin-protein ligase parkin-like isoform X4 n=1 Tax=Dermacentor silvarum TaxID=543639 RepID=UPI00210080C7|nr:E3 ubiquitin-protein ligase parkin-like isoform X4 [Dermacentor silvarum]